MADNHDRFALVVAAAGRPNWVELSARFAAMGLRDRAGNPPSSTHTRLTWLWVRKAHAKAHGLPIKRASDVPSQTPPPPPPREDDDDFGGYREPRRQFHGKPAVDRARMPKKEES